ncbi:MULTISPECIES: Holliday junction branch migration protein RuvA [unclassified Fusibacter]|uniref:Holliday junction branch migration protein RuvA n=1 Tax=unclassified Fusibacter TaxID=2624464 RepID=UPI0013E94DB9|nr:MULTISPECIES: Holliday junction branch migration protein RuvA [unclassified Fusibacter]MCK8059065.1 Holliday junction branch migration protein RuvA [Fusibacter sp. A2]NPE22474.1 Holliday junction branch migration protein RuvA [Fusibacter sp. A1]
MYRYIKGEVVEKGLDHIVLDVGGIGYYLSATTTSITHVKLGEVSKLYTKLMIKEDEHSLCGFTDENELIFFEHLISVSGIGKRVAMGMLSNESYARIMEWIITANEKMLTGLPGLGKKTSQRVIVELRDKLKKTYGADLKSAGSFSEGVMVSSSEDVMLALLGLGFKKDEINSMLSGVDLATLSVEDAIKYALTHNRN